MLLGDEAQLISNGLGACLATLGWLRRPREVALRVIGAQRIVRRLKRGF
jgi:hypothetical protein